MKKILFALALFAFVVPAIPRANGAEISVDLFYNNLSGGNWVEVGDYGYGWQPGVAVSNADWRPYADGYWAYTDYGWTWVSYEDFGWATYHYGRWARLADYGWVWFPGSDLEWGPAWVSWRFGGNRCGWAPLPPRGPGIVYEGRPIGGQVDVEFDIGPAYYNFVDIRYIGAPVLRSHLYAVTENVTYINETVNVTNISVRNNVVYNYGPDYNVLSQYSERPIQRLRVERQSNVDIAAAAKSGEITKVQGDRLMVAAPQKIQRSARQVAPPAVKTKIAKDKVKIERGWSVAGDEKAQAELKQKIKSQDSKKVPPPTEGKAAEAAGGGSPPQMQSPAGTPGVGAEAGAGAAAGAGASPMEKGKHGKRGETGQQATEGSPAEQASPAAAEHGKHKGKRGEMEKASPPTGAATETGEPVPGSGKHKGKRGEMEKASPPTGAATETGETVPGGGKHKGKRGEMEKASPPTGATTETGEPVPGSGKHKGKRGEMEKTSPPTGATTETGEPVPGGGKHKGKPNENVTQPGSTAPGETAPGHGKHKGKPGEPNQPESTFTPGGSTGAEQNIKKGGKKGRPEQVGAASEEQAPMPGGPEQGKPKGHQAENMPMTGGAPAGETKGAKQKPQKVEQPQPAGAGAGAEHGHGKPEGGKKKKGEKEESPPPQ